MRLLVYGFFMAWGMFLAIPCPLKIWDEKARAHMLLCFPLTGLLVGGLWYIAAAVLKDAPEMLRALAVAVFPWLCTGFIHLDGYMDVSDAVLSRRDLETRQKILKDSHCGAFAVISFGILLIAQFSAACSLQGACIAMVFLPAAVRASASIAVLVLRPMHTSQYAYMERRSFAVAGAAAFLAILCVLPLLLQGISGISVLCGVTAYWLAVWYGFRQLDGINGDISGFALCIGEFTGLFAMAIL